MSETLFHVLFDFSKHPHGGGSSFLGLLKQQFEKNNEYTSDPKTASIIIFNSHQNAASVMAARRHNRQAVFIQRVDGPMSIYNRPDDPRDDIVKTLGSTVADGLVFQSQWSFQECKKLGLVPSRPYVVIPNAPDPNIFLPKSRMLEKDVKVRLVGTNWSPHLNKGFATYDWMEKNLDFSKYEVILIGKSPKNYRNIQVIPPMAKTEMKAELDKAHIFVMPSRFEACSNALVEALHMGLPVLAYAGSSNVELVTNPAMLYKDENEIPHKLESILAQYENLAGLCHLPTIEQVARRYKDFCLSVTRSQNESSWKLFQQEMIYRLRRIQ